MVQITGELGEPPERVLDLWRLDELRGIAIDDGALVLGALTTYTEIRRSPTVPRASASARRGGGDDRRGADPEPRHARRQHRQRVAGRRHAAGPAGRGRASSCSAAPRGERAVAAATSGRRTAGPRCAADELLAAHPHPAPGRPPGPLPQGRHAPRPGDLQGRDGARLARGRRRRGAMCALALGSVAADPDPRRRDRARRWRAPRRTPRRGGPLPRPPWPPRSTRSTTCARPPITAAWWPRASCTGCCAKRAAGSRCRSPVPSASRSRCSARRRISGCGSGAENHATAGELFIGFYKKAVRKWR